MFIFFRTSMFSRTSVFIVYIRFQQRHPCYRKLLILEEQILALLHVLPHSTWNVHDVANPQIEDG